MIRLVLDTNTLISAIGWKKGNPRKIFEDCLFGKYKLIESLDLINELLDVIQRPKFAFISSEDKQEFLVHLFQMCDLVKSSKEINIIKDDPKDNIVLECAIEGRADYIISGDSHLLELKQFKNIKILTPKEFLDFVNIQK